MYTKEKNVDKRFMSRDTRQPKSIVKSYFGIDWTLEPFLRHEPFHSTD